MPPLCAGHTSGYPGNRIRPILPHSGLKGPTPEMANPLISPIVLALLIAARPSSLPVAGMPVMVIPVMLSEKGLTGLRHRLIISNGLAQALDLAPRAGAHIRAELRHVVGAGGVERGLPRGNLGLHLGQLLLALVRDPGLQTEKTARKRTWAGCKSRA
jgi:hypothetical protein